MTRIVLILCGLFLAYFAPTYLSNEREKSSFSIEKIALHIEEDLPVFPISEEAINILQGPFSYLGSGGQSIAFQSDDQKYVLKFFLIKSLHGKKKNILRNPTHWFSFHREKKHKMRMAQKKRHLLEALQSYCIAFPLLQEKSAILALHLRSTQDHLPAIQLIDQEGLSHTLDLNVASFVLQKKVKTVAETFENKALSREETKQLLLSLQDFFQKRTLLGMIDLDRQILLGENYGFLDGAPIQFDLGRLVLNSSRNPQEEIERMYRVVRAWAEERHISTEGIL